MSMAAQTSPRSRTAGIAAIGPRIRADKLTPMSCPAFIRRLLLVLACIVFEGGGAFASFASTPQDDAASAARRRTVALAAARSAAQPAAAEAAREFARWSWKRDLYREEATAYENVLTFEPDDPVARKAAGYVKKGGAWTRPAGYKPRPNGPAADAAGLVERRNAAYAGYRDALLPVVADDAGWDLAGIKARGEVLDELARFLPNDAAVRAACGEIREGDRWLLEETPAARLRRAEIKRLAAAAVKDVPTPAAAETSAEEDAAGADFKAVLRTPLVRIAASTDAAEAAHVLKACHASIALFSAVFGATEAKPGLSGFVFAPADAPKFLAGHPAVDDAARKSSAKMSGMWIKGRPHFVEFSSDADRRVDGASRQVLGHLLGRRFGLRSDRGALFEGAGGHLTWLVLGTRFTSFVRPTSYDRDSRDPLHERIRKSGADLFAEAAAVLARDDAPRFENILRVDVNGLDAASFVCGYAFVAYLIEAHPKAFEPVVAGIAEGRLPEEVLATVLRTTPDRLARRLARFLSER